MRRGIRERRVWRELPPVTLDEEDLSGAGDEDDSGETGGVELALDGDRVDLDRVPQL